eukprot:TRINITY_DN5726_c0_g1_i1.p1 TRINITY_DN5726_c0_g1~~TRINITY_DN5726_c0_g1_i1.p1  ORF type:complete len:633 (+),score=227.88 TRINITY_DN5726_c0_g1_i1:134-2032(+)
MRAGSAGTSQMPPPTAPAELDAGDKGAANSPPCGVASSHQHCSAVGLRAASGSAEQGFQFGEAQTTPTGTPTQQSLREKRQQKQPSAAGVLGINTDAALRDVEKTMKKKVRELAMWQKKVAGSARRQAAHHPSPRPPPRQACTDFVVEMVFRVFQFCTWLSDNFLGWGMLVSTALAYKFPSFGRQGGPLRPEYSVNSVTAALFFICGLMFRRDRVRDALLHFRLNAFGLAFTFLVVPALTYGALMSPQLSRLFSVDLRLGILVSACMPPSTTTSIILTHAAGGNEGVAVANTALGHLVGVLLSPALISLAIASPQFTEKVRTVRPAVLRLLVGAIFLPMLAGQLCQVFLPKGKSKGHTPAALLPLLRDDDRCDEPVRGRGARVFGQLSQLLLLVLNFYVFCSCFAHLREADSRELSSSVVPLFAFLVAQQVVQVGLCWALLSSCALDPAARVAALLCCANKTEGLAIPLVITMFDRTRLGLLPVPIVLHNCAQAILGAVLTSPLRAWLRQERARQRASACFARLDAPGFAGVFSGAGQQPAPDWGPLRPSPITPAAIPAGEVTPSERSGNSPPGGGDAAERLHPAREQLHQRRDEQPPSPPVSTPAASGDERISGPRAHAAALAAVADSGAE